MKDSIVIYTGNLAKIKVKANSLELTSTAEKELVKLLKAQAALAGILDMFKATIGDAMEASNSGLIERGAVKITRTTTGRKFSFDPDKTHDDKFMQTISYPSPNSKAIDAYVELEGKVPEGIVENARKQKIEIELIES